MGRKSLLTNTTLERVLLQKNLLSFHTEIEIDPTCQPVQFQHTLFSIHPCVHESIRDELRMTTQDFPSSSVNRLKFDPVNVRAVSRANAR